MRHPFRDAVLFGLALLAVAHAACSDDNTGSPPQPIHIRMLALGDSYTVGEGIAEGKSWPNQLSEALEDDRILVDELTVVAHTGWTSTVLLDTLTAAPPSPHDFVTLQIGANNVFGRVPFAIFESDFVDLLELAIALAGDDAGRVLVLTIPDYTVTEVGSQIDPEAARVEIDGYNDLIRRVSADQHVALIDVTEISRMALEDPTLVARDGLHPSAKQYALWVEVIRPVVVEKFRRRSIFEMER
jgi:acyl-CoA thioesterase-1